MKLDSVVSPLPCISWATAQPRLRPRPYYGSFFFHRADIGYRTINDLKTSNSSLIKKATRVRRNTSPQYEQDR